MICDRNFLGLYMKLGVFALRLAGKTKAESYTFKPKVLVNYFAKKYLPVAQNLPKKEITTKKTEIIWQFWDNPEGKKTPEIINACLKTTEKFKGDFEHKILNSRSLENYADLPNFVLDKFKKGQMGYAHFSDLLRLNLLKNHGGIWLDATGYMTDFIPQYIINEDFFVFLCGEKTHFPYAFMQNCFIRSKKGSFLCESWYEMCLGYWKANAKTIDYFQHQLIFKALVENSLIAKDLFNKMPHISEDETHQLVGDELLREFDEVEWGQIKKTSFFQKLTYKTNAVPMSDSYFAKLSEGTIHRKSSQ